MNLFLRLAYALLLVLVMCVVVPWSALRAAYVAANLQLVDGLNLILDVLSDNK